MVNWMDYRSFRIELKAVYESTAERLIRGDYRSRIVGYYFHLWMPIGEGRLRRIKDESDEYPTREVALDMAQGMVDAIADSLE